MVTHSEIFPHLKVVHFLVGIYVGQGETVCIGLVVGQLCVNIIVDVPLFGKSQSDNEFRCCGHRGKTHDVPQGSRRAEGVVLKLGQKELSIIGLLLELVQGSDLFDVLLEI